MKYKKYKLFKPDELDLASRLKYTYVEKTEDGYLMEKEVVQSHKLGFVAHVDHEHLTLEVYGSLMHETVTTISGAREDHYYLDDGEVYLEGIEITQILSNSDLQEIIEKAVEDASQNYR